MSEKKNDVDMCMYAEVYEMEVLFLFIILKQKPIRMNN